MEGEPDSPVAINIGSGNNIVAELLRKDNHENWRACLQNYLLSQDLWEVVEDETEPPKAENDETGYKAWRKKNAAALHAIQISCSPHLLAQIRERSSASDAWGTLADLCEPTPIVPAQALTTQPVGLSLLQLAGLSLLQGTTTQPAGLSLLQGPTTQPADSRMAINTGSGNNIVAELLRKDNHENWRACMKNYLLSQDLWEVVEDETEPPKAEEDEAGYKAWRKKNAAALHAIQISCSPYLLAQIREKTSARDAWGTLADLCEPTPIMHAQAQPVTTEPTLIVSAEAQPTPIVPAEAQPPTTEPTPIVSAEAQPTLIVPAEAEPPTTQPDIGSSAGHSVESITRYSLPLLKAVCEGDLDTTRLLLTKHPDLVSASIVRGVGRTAFHFAVLGTLEIMDEFLPNMSKGDSEQQSTLGATALHFTAMYKGKTNIAQRLIQKSMDLLTIPNHRNEIPLVTACRNGHKDIIHYLYSMTPPEFLLSSQNLYHANWAVCYCIDNEIFDVALHLLKRCRQLAIYNGANRNAVWSLSCQTSAFLSTSGLSFWQRCVYYCLKVEKPDTSFDDVRIYTNQQDQKITMNSILKGKLLGLWSNVLTFIGIKQIYDLKQKHLYANELLVLISETIVGLAHPQIYANDVNAAIFNAAKQGMTEFIIEIIKANMDLLWNTDNFGRNIFHCAVANRQEKTFSLIYGLDFMKTEFGTYGDWEGNSMLHLAGQVSDDSQLAQISGAALQMQRELQWFEEVESIVRTSLKKTKNKSRKTPYELFHQSHGDMMKEGEKWMKDIAQSSIIVGTLIITIMFAALYTVPGGNNQETGIPLLLTRKAFKVFVISDAISLFASSTSVLMFVGLLTSRYTAKDFLKSLPTKLIIALSSLFISIATMMIAFSSTVIIMLKGQLAIVIPIVLLASVPISLFIWLQFPLLVRMIISTYGPGIFDRKMKNWLI